MNPAYSVSGYLTCHLIKWTNQGIQNNTCDSLARRSVAVVAAERGRHRTVVLLSAIQAPPHRQSRWARKASHLPVISFGPGGAA